MRLTLCGSIACYPRMEAARQQLEQRGHEVRLPPIEVPGQDGKLIPVGEYYRIRKAAPAGEAWVWERKAQAIRAHFEKVAWADAIVVVNGEKNGIPGYVGANTLIEMGVAFFLRKPIYLLHPVPDLPWREELRGMHPIVLEGELARISKMPPTYG